ncbi:YhjD/YihY/BrkB family envelope integrity protein [Piscicoccus intestinalis]|uniref:YhjD/YihY/BrkB family envelope integrity protein n=1 Tax=Piscicoccus intestinalis TaxID=746033 RepID=UPI0009FC2DEB|nr:YhjD/YihY/BrkB family envelope integrity protein [Piscicoccus intestinalis]
MQQRLAARATRARDGATRLTARTRARSPLVDHVVRAVGQYRARQGSTLAAAVTYYAFLSFFPMLALAFAAVGAISAYAPDARQSLEQGLQAVLPGMIGAGQGRLSLSTIESAAAPVAGLGGLAVLYSGLGWIGNMRSALQAMFDTPLRDRPGFVTGYARDLVVLVVIGVVLVLGVALTGLVTGFSTRIAEFIGLQTGLAWLLQALSLALGVLASTVLFTVMFRLLAEPPVSAGAVRSGALLGGVSFEVLKQASTWLLASTTRQPAFQAFGIALILLVWIYYFSRVVMFAAAWARTARSPGAVKG